jgi:hypothetical protein
MNLTDEQVDTIIEAHSDTVEGLKSEIDTLKKGSHELAEVRKQLENATKELETAKKDGWKDKHDAVKKEFDEYKASQTAKETAVAKEKAVRAYFEKQNITGQSLEIAMKGSKDEIAALELDENGGIKDDKALKELVDGTFKGLVSTVVTKGADVAKPVKTTSGQFKSKEEIMAIADRAERRAAIAANQNLFSKGE